MDQKFIFGGTNGYGDSYLEFFSLHFNVFSLQAKLHDAAGAARVRSCKARRHYYVIGRGLISCLLGHGTGLLHCLYVNFFLSPIFDSFDV